MKITEIRDNKINSISHSDYIGLSRLMALAIECVDACKYKTNTNIYGVDKTRLRVASTICYAMLVYKDEIEFSKSDIENYDCLMESGLYSDFHFDKGFIELQKLINEQVELVEKESSLERILAEFTVMATEAVEDIKGKVSDVLADGEKSEKIIDMLSKLVDIFIAKEKISEWLN